MKYRPHFVNLLMRTRTRRMYALLKRCNDSDLYLTGLVVHQTVEMTFLNNVELFPSICNAKLYGTICYESCLLSFHIHQYTILFEGLSSFHSFKDSTCSCVVSLYLLCLFYLWIHLSILYRWLITKSKFTVETMTPKTVPFH